MLLVGQACLMGLVQVLSWPECGLLAAGVVAGAVVGILPGLGGAAALAILMPFTLALPPSEAFALLIGVAAVVATTGDLTSILVGIPGEGVSAATVVDGHQLTLRGQAARALGASLVSSLVGSVFGALTLALAIPFAAWLAPSVGRPNCSCWRCWASRCSLPSAGPPLKGLMAAGARGLFATIGWTRSPPATICVGQLVLWDGIGDPLPSVCLRSRKSCNWPLAPRPRPYRPTGFNGLLSDVLACASRWRVVLQSSALGSVVGLLPGVGANISQWVAYGVAAREAPEIPRSARARSRAPSRRRRRTTRHWGARSFQRSLSACRAVCSARCC